MTERSPFFVTTAISYPNGVPHIGHAYEAIATDAIARFQRLDGREVFFLTGTDEHGQKMLQTARKEDIPVAELAERNADRFKAMVGMLGCSNDDFIRTSEERHHAACQEIWRRMEANGDIYKDSYSGWYSVRDEAYYQESETELRADGVRYGPQGTPVEWVEEESYFFRLSQYQDKLLAHYEANPDFIGPDERRNEVVSFVKGGLKDLSVSRTTFDWGVKVPGDERHVMYVWVDALTNYLTATGFPDENAGRARFWPANLHVIGKDIVRFHAVYWPAFLMSAGLPIPGRVYAHGFLFNRGEKMSKSVGNVIDPFALVDHYGLDSVRYFFLREVPFGQDGNYSHDAIVNRINADLANDLGNLAQRSLSMIGKNCEGRLPAPGRFHGRGPGHSGSGRCDDRKCARGHVASGNPPDARHRVGLCGRGKPLFCLPGALGTEEDRSAAHEHGALRHRRGHSPGCDPCPAGGADERGKAARSPVACAGGRGFDRLGPEGRLVPGTELPKPSGVFPRYVEAEKGEAADA